LPIKFGIRDRRACCAKEANVAKLRLLGVRAPTKDRCSAGLHRHSPESLAPEKIEETIKHVDRQRARRQFNALRLNGDEDFGTDRT
jgi:hypothetical protein